MDGFTVEAPQNGFQVAPPQKSPTKPAAASAPPNPGVLSAISNAFGAEGKSLLDDWHAYQQRESDTLESLRKDVLPKNVQEFNEGGAPIDRAVKTALDAAGFITSPTAMLGRAVEKPVTQVTGSQTAGKMAGSAAEIGLTMAIPGAGETAASKAPVIEGWPERAPSAGFKAGRDLDEVLHRVTTNNQADVSEARQYIESLPKEYQSPEFQERVYHEIEQRSVDPRAKFSPDVQKFVEGSDFKDWYAKQKPLYDWIKAHKNGEDLMPDAPTSAPSITIGGRPLNAIQVRQLSKAETLPDKPYLVFDSRKKDGYLGVFPTEKEAVDFIDKHPDERFLDYGTPRLLERLNPSGPAYSEDEWERLQAKIKDAIGGANLNEPTDTSSGYVHRIAQGKGSRYDASDPGNREVLVPGGRSLPRKAESENARKFFVLDDGKGNRTFVPPGKGSGLVPGEQHVGSDGQTYTARYATTQEVEANTPVRYHKNAVVNTVENVLKLQRVKRSLETLDAIKAEGEAQGLMYPDYQRTGGLTYASGTAPKAQLFKRTNTQAPRHFVYPNIPQLRDVKMDPHLAQSLNDFYGHIPDNKSVEAADAVNRFLTRSIFFNPVPHLQNVGAFWTVARGSDWARPAGYGALVRTGAKAIREVAMQGPLVKQMLREGSALQYPRTANQNFYKLMIARMGKDIEGDPQTWKGVLDNFGFSTPKDLVKQIYRTSQKAMWMGSDMMMVQRVLELQEKGMALPEAIKEAERWIPNYRVPSQVWNGPGGRAASQMLQSPSGIMFGRYKYDQVKLIANLAHDLAAGTTAQRKEALAKAAVLVGMATAAYPLADAALHKIMGRDDVRFRRAGPLAIPDALWQLDQGQKDWASALSTIVTPAPLIQATTEGFRNQDFFGRPIVDSRATPLGQAVQGGEWTLGQVAPVGEAEETMKPGGAEKVGLRNIGIQEKPKGTPPRVERRLRRAAGRREGGDAIEQALRNAFGQ